TIPAEDTWFHIYYRLGNGVRGNLPAESINNIDPAITFITSVRNPLPATGGVDPELPADVRRAAPDAFKAITFRAVTRDDYIEAAQRLPWVQRAGAEFRWTGSWLSARVTADPRGEPTLSRARRTELVDHLDRFRQAGREVHTLSPLYADLDL